MIDWTVIVLAVIGLVQAVALGVIAMYTKQIHTSVNSERTATLDEIRELKTVILKMSVDKATRDERENPTT